MGRNPESAPTGSTGSTIGSHPTARELRVAERAENFPVAMRLLPGRDQRRLRVLYDTVRTIDDTSDRTPGDATAALHALRDDLDRIWTPGPGPQAPVLRRLAETVRELGLSAAPFHGLIAAGLADQQVTAYGNFGELRDYCRLSADPVGRLVLATFGVRDPAAEALSDQVCTALQLLEHWQDVAEDRRLGRIYLPADDMAAFGVVPADLDAAVAGPSLRALLRFETDRAARLLVAGSRLVGSLRGFARVAVAGYVGGGVATVQALRRSGFDSLRATPRPRPADVAVAALRVAVHGDAAWAATLCAG
ncbi:MAG TPA: squalene synthase HpnC [Sporichthyaceae bacterium]|jgi:squalene synthase HpnC|nr:squalene synthase HpnC [Sporichthyaceae bacterium]